MIFDHWKLEFQTSSKCCISSPPQDFYHKMIELSSEARTAYEVMVTNLEQTNQAEAKQSLNTDEELQFSSLTETTDANPEHIQPEEPEYSKLLSCSFKGNYTNEIFLKNERNIWGYVEDAFTVVIWQNTTRPGWTLPLARSSGIGFSPHRDPNGDKVVEMDGLDKNK